MKPVSLLMLVFLLGLAACGKDNKSGKKNYGAFGFSNQYGVNSGFSIDQVVNENPCIGGGGGYPGGYPAGYPNQNAYGRLSGSIPAQVNTVIPPGDSYVGVTSYGDVAMIVSNGQGAVLQYSLCPRTMSSQPSQPAYNVSLFPYTNCGFKQMNASLRLADGSVANFRMMDYGTSAGSKFSYCR